MPSSMNKTCGKESRQDRDSPDHCFQDMCRYWALAPFAKG